MGSLVKVDNLRYSYGDRQVLKNICASFKPGMVCGLLGPNGSGKTTLLKNIASILKPKKNAVYIDSKDVTKMTPPEIAKEMALVPQSTYIDFDFTVEDIVMMGRTPHIRRFSNESSEDKEIVQWALETSRIIHLKDRSIKAISGGELQRVVIARALAQKTQIILLDEPVSQLDIHHQLSIMETIAKLSHEQKLTIVTVLHDLNLAAEYCDIIYLLKEGSIVSGGFPKDVLTYDMIENVYDIICLVYENPVSKKPHIIPVRSKKADAE